MNLDHLLDHPYATFHDSILERVEIDYVEKRARLIFRVCTGDPNSEDSIVRESWRPGQLLVTGLMFLVIGPPDEKYPYQKGGGLRVDDGEVSESVPKNAPPLPKNLPSTTFVHWFFVNEWNSFIYLAATGVEFKWL